MGFHGYDGAEALDAGFHEDDGEQFGSPGDEAGEFGLVLFSIPAFSDHELFPRFYFDRKYDESPPGYEDDDIVITDYQDGGDISSEESYLNLPDVYNYQTDRSLLSCFTLL